MDNHEYKLHICKLCNKLIEHNYIIIDFNSEEKEIKIKIKQGELFFELNDDDKFNVEQNLKIHFTKKIISLLEKDLEEIFENEVKTPISYKRQRLE